ncbi:MAG: AraC family transcriptional regulator [Beijerinckiaceae bacterium]|nr:AraC family transcriptional regulator [Beijerinckiaceae bacterium]
MWLSLTGKTVHDGSAMPGSLHVTLPSVAARCVFNGPFDALHLHVPNTLIEDCAQDLPQGSLRGLSKQDGFFRAPWIERFGQTLLLADELHGALGQRYIDSLGTAFVAKLLSEAGRATSGEGRGANELAKWRLKRAVDYIDDNLDGSVTLADVSAAAGLTRMHFAAQFKASTGLRPHEYLLRRRVEKAQQLLATRNASVVDVALSVGFESQSHFTTVFKRFVGKPPHAWRQSNDFNQSKLPN